MWTCSRGPEILRPCACCRRRIDFQTSVRKYGVSGNLYRQTNGSGWIDPPLLFIYASSNKKSVYQKVEKDNFVANNDNLLKIFTLNNVKITIK